MGDIVVFGDIRWYVIAKTETGCTLLSEKPVIKMPFNEAGYQTIDTWDKSTLREWLNEKFYNTFTEEEKALIEKILKSESISHKTCPEQMAVKS